MIVRKYHLILFLIVILLALSWGIARRSPAFGVARFDNLLINEFVAVNRTGLSDEDGDHSDWIELYNAGQNSVNLSGWSLTDDPKNPNKWRFPDITLRGGDYLLVFASAKNRRDPNSPLHANFKLNRKGEYLALYNIFSEQLSTMDASPFPAQFKDTAYGRRGDEASYGYLNSPTPGQANAESLAWQGIVSDLAFSFQRGFYDEAIAVELFTATPGASIYYTTDGSEPGEMSGALYTKAIPITNTTLLRAAAYKSNFHPSPIATHSYLYLADILDQPPNPANFPPDWGVYSKNRDSYKAVKGEPIIADYEMDPKIAQDPRYREPLIEGLKSLPSLSLVTDIANFDIYANPQERGEAWERPVSLELIYPDGKKKGFQVNAGLRIQGNAGRNEFMPKRGFRLFFKETYGASKLEYPLFPDSPLKSFNTLVLRGGVNRGYAGYLDKDHITDHRLTTYTRDEWLRASQIEMSGLSSHGIFVHLYLNGLYWGLYNLVERPDAAFAEAYLGGDEAEWSVVNQNGVVNGSTERFERLHQLAREGTLEQPEKYAEIQSYLDINQFIDYVILNWYAGNQDWGHNNWYALTRNPAGKTSYYAWDGEVIWLDGANDRLGEINAEGEPNRIKVLFRALLANQDFRMAFTDRLYRHLFNNGALTDENAKARWLRLNREIESAIIAESARWGDARYETPITQEDWFKARDDVLTQMEGNAAKMLTMGLDNYGFYPSFNPPAFNQRGGLVPPDFELTLDAVSGVVYYTTDGSDPRAAVTGEVAPAAQLYRAPLVLTATSHVKTRLRVDDAWSALDEAIFTVVERDSGLRVTEIMYNPLGGDKYEFIELTNAGGAPFSLAQSHFEGISFTFPADAPLLLPGESVVLVRNPTAFAQRYPYAPIGGVYEGQLSNKGETITLKDWQGKVIASATYNDEAGWPLSPDGSGDSLVLVSPTGDPNNPKNWRASPQIHGSPGEG